MTEENEARLMEIEEAKLEELKSIHKEIADLNVELDAIGAPWTPGRLPEWQ